MLRDVYFCFPQASVMARRRKSSTAEDIMDLVAMLPWWAGVVLAIVSYWILHGIASAPVPALQPGHQVAQVATSAIWQGLATVGQFLLPILCLFGAAMSAMRRKRRNALFDSASSSSADVLDQVTWQQFEQLVGEGFRRRGYTVREIGGGGADGGVDLVFTKAGDKTFVQCKQWKAFKVGVTTVRELYGVMAAHGAAHGFVVTSGRFTQDASSFARGRNLTLIDGPALLQLLREARSTTVRPGASNAVKSMTNARPVSAATSIPRMAAPIESVDPFCPRCGKVMERRMARRGPAAGKAFWGCSDFAAGCRGSRAMQDS